MIYIPVQDSGCQSVSFAEMVQEECQAWLDTNERAVLQAAAASVDRYTDLLTASGPLVIMRNSMRSALFCALHDVGAHDLAERYLCRYVKLPTAAQDHLRVLWTGETKPGSLSHLLFSGVLRGHTSLTAYNGVIWVLDLHHVLRWSSRDMLDLYLLPQMKLLIEHTACIFDRDCGRGSIGLSNWSSEVSCRGKEVRDMHRSVMSYAGCVVNWCGQRRGWLHVPELFSLS